MKRRTNGGLLEAADVVFFVSLTLSYVSSEAVISVGGSCNWPLTRSGRARTDRLGDVCFNSLSAKNICAWDSLGVFGSSQLDLSRALIID